jgi:putative DNA primase/helicase
MSIPAPLAYLIADPCWTAWRNEIGDDGRPTKIPYCAVGHKAESDNPATWLPHDQAVTVRDAIVNGSGGGIGIWLGQHGYLWIAGIDLDTCRDPVSTLIAPWAVQVIQRFASYTEVSPSGGGVKISFLVDPADAPELRTIMGTQHGRQFKQANGASHPPAIELYVSHRYFTITWEGLPDAPKYLRTVPLDDLMPAKRLSRGRIDGMTALIMALGRSMAEDLASPYSDGRDLRVI